MPRIFGEIEGVNVGDVFESRRELSEAGVHRPLQAGISGSQYEGADSIVLSGGYVDDKDYGDVIIYTGQGGRDEQTERQVADQKLERGNKALAISFQENLPVRVVRGAQHKSYFSPESGYRYDGLYEVTSYWQEKGRDGYKIWRFKLERIELDSTETKPYLKTNNVPYRVESTVNRIVRDSSIADRVKKMYNNHCQVCGTAIKTPLRFYSEAAHIKPLGEPHNGTDDISNVLCLCPNHHKMLDYHSFSIADDFSLIGIEGKLNVKKKHFIDKECLRYHREHFYEDLDD